MRYVIVGCGNVVPITSGRLRAAGFAFTVMP
jgi:hypothetical protein